MNILGAIRDPNLFRPFLGADLSSWEPWSVALRCLYGLPIHSRRGRRLVRECTGRSAAKLPPEGFNTALFLTGRRSGKSRIAAIIGAFESSLAERELRLSKGERGVVPVLAPTRHQSQVVKGYLRSIFDTPLLRPEVIRETKDGFELRNKNVIEVLTGDWRTVRAFTLLAAIVDEACFLGMTEESKVKSDTELIRALKPGLATVQGKLICISSPYARRGWSHSQFKRHFRNDDSKVLVWNCPSRTMNPTLPQSVVDEAMAEDLAAAKSEYLGEFRDDVGEFVPRSVIERLVVEGRKELLPREKIHYTAFCDVSGGRGDDAALAIAHRVKRMVVLDFARRWRPPFSPHQVIGSMAEELRRYSIRRITGDNYSAEFVASSFRANGIHYLQSEKPKAALYLELLPRLCSGEVELLDDVTLVDQLAGLERRTRSGGRDIIDHPPGGHDDLANAVAGVTTVATANRIILGAAPV